MSEIQVIPADLTHAASDIRNHAKRLQAAIDAVDNDIRALDSNAFEGIRADTLRARYNKIRDKIFNFKRMLENFAKELDEASARFSAADKV